MKRKWSRFNIAAIIIGLTFLYLPILFLVVLSFNNSKLVTVWGGFSTRWYVSLLNNESLMEAMWVSLRLAFFSSGIATVLGTLAALALTGVKPIAGRTVLSCMLFGVLMMPEIIIGVSLLLLFVSVGMSLGFFTVMLAHITFTMCFIVVIVRSSLDSLDHSLSEAAMDLGATPIQTFFHVTLPLILPSVISGWFLSFTLSLDDLIIANFTSGPGATTLPMRIYSQVRLGVTPEINAACAIMIAVIAVTIILAGFINNKSWNLSKNSIKNSSKINPIKQNLKS